VADTLRLPVQLGESRVSWWFASDDGQTVGVVVAGMPYVLLPSQARRLRDWLDALGPEQKPSTTQIRPRR
jgi:hypothetical protein